MFSLDDKASTRFFYTARVRGIIVVRCLVPTAPTARHRCRGYFRATRCCPYELSYHLLPQRPRYCGHARAAQREQASHLQAMASSVVFQRQSTRLAATGYWYHCGTSRTGVRRAGHFVSCASPVTTRHKSSNHAMQPTAGRRTPKISMTQTSSPAAMRALASGG